MSSFSLYTTPPATQPPPPRRRHVSMSAIPPNPKTLITTISNLLWGQSLPPQLLISAVRSSWYATWHLMMSQLAPSDPDGNYSRPTSQFSPNSQFAPQKPTTATINPIPTAQFPPKKPTFPPINPIPTYQFPPISRFSRRKPTNLHLYVGLSCPWAHRALIVRALKGLEGSVPVSVASPGIDGSWEFVNGDVANGCKTLRGVYELRRGGYKGRATVPMLWDVGEREVACNESYDIIEFFNSGLNEVATNPELDLEPVGLKGEIEKWNRVIYPNVNNGVYRCGFAQSQQAYDSAVNELFSTLDMLDNHLGSSRYLCGDVLTLADICLFTTLIRFDLVYNVLFKCTKRKLIEYPNLHAYMCDIYQMPKVAATCDFEAIMDGYYKILFPLNPSSIRPAMPLKCEHDFLSEPHNRRSLSSLDEVQPIPVA